MAVNKFTIPGSITGVGGVTSQTFTTPAKLEGAGRIVGNNGGTVFNTPGTITGTGRVVPAQRTKWASLSDDIIFEANHSPVDMEHDPTIANFVEQALLVGKPRMQKQGLKLQEIKITCKFHFSIRPFKKVKAALLDAAANGTVLQWIYGTGEALGDFVIIGFKEKPKKTDEIGAYYATEIELTLREYAGPGVEEQTGINDKKKAFANKPLGTVSPLPSKGITSSELMSKNVQITKVQSLKVETTLDKLKKGVKSLETAKREIQKACGKIKKAINNIDSAIAIARNLKNAPSITSAASLVAVASDSLNLAAGGNTSVAELTNLANSVSVTTGSLGQAAEGAQTVKGWFATLGF